MDGGGASGGWSEGGTAAGPSDGHPSSASSQQPPPAATAGSDSESASFECNICLDTAKDAVVSLCGHLFWYVHLSEPSSRNRCCMLLLFSCCLQFICCLKDSGFRSGSPLLDSSMLMTRRPELRDPLFLTFLSFSCLSPARQQTNKQTTSETAPTSRNEPGCNATSSPAAGHVCINGWKRSLIVRCVRCAKRRFHGKR